MYQHLGQRISDIRRQKGVSLESLAETSQIEYEVLEALEQGSINQVVDWPVQKVMKLAEALDVNVSTLLSEAVLNYEEWALIWAALIEYSAHRPGLKMKADMKALIEKVSSFLPEHYSVNNQRHG